MGTPIGLWENSRLEGTSSACQATFPPDNYSLFQLRCRLEHSLHMRLVCQIGEYYEKIVGELPQGVPEAVSSLVLQVISSMIILSFLPALSLKGCLKSINITQILILSPLTYFFILEPQPLRPNPVPYDYLSALAPISSSSTHPL
jgi:hypothetical protein